MTKKRLLPLLLLAALSAGGFATTTSGAQPAAIGGTWKIDPTKSTELSPWKDYDLTIAIEGKSVAIHRRLAAGRREFSDTMTLDTSRPVNVVPVDMWPDNRHLGAYIGGDRTKRVRTEWLDGGRILRLSTDLVLNTQQGDHAVNILSDYKVSANGAQLTLTELRSSRNRPVVYTFTRVPAAAK